MGFVWGAKGGTEIVRSFATFSYGWPPFNQKANTQVIALHAPAKATTA